MKDVDVGYPYPRFVWLKRESGYPLNARVPATALTPGPTDRFVWLDRIDSESSRRSCYGRSAGQSGRP